MRAWIGATLGACAAALTFIAWGTSYEAATLGGGQRLHEQFILGGIGAAAVLGFLIGAAKPRPKP